MTGRERVQAALRFERPDRLPCYESFWEGVVEQWRKQGMPPGISAEDYFDFDLRTMALDASPRFEQRILSREGRYYTYEDRYGYTATRLEHESGTVRFSNFKTTDRTAWEQVKKRMKLSDDPRAPARIDDQSYFGHFTPYPTWPEAVEKFRRLYATGKYHLLLNYGPMEASWRHRGHENLLMDLAEDPDWCRDMARTFMDLTLDILEKCLQLGIHPDGYFNIEDLAYTRSMLLAPDLWRRVYQPQLQRLGEFLRAHHIDFWFHTDGDVRPILDDLIDCGVRVLNPLEVNAGMDMVKLRQRYGKQLVFFGNISVRAILDSPQALEAELRRKIPLSREGGYILHSDHSIPPQVSFERYQGMLQTARRIFDQT